MAFIAEILVNIPKIHKPFSYAIPDNLSYIGIGWRVLVSFGQRKIEGFIIALNEGDVSELKPIIDVLDNEPWFNDNMLRTARWVQEYYLCSLAEAMRLFIPGKTGIKTDKYYSIKPQIADDAIKVFLEDKPAIYHSFWNYLREKGPVKSSVLTKHFGKGTSKILREFLLKGLAAAESTTKKILRSKYKNVINLNVNIETAAAQEKTLNGKKAQQRLLSALINKGHLTTEDLHLLNISKATVQKVVETGLIKIEALQIFRDSYKEIGKSSENPVIQLNSYQLNALKQIIPIINNRKFQSFLLHGITGSGKTQVYIEAVAAARQKNRQAIVIVPEIALTGQTVARFKQKFGTDVVVMHSKLSVGERYDSWQRIRNKEAGIVIGARSAIFAPVEDIGIIILDEEHEFTYKQEETPHYHTRQVAITRAEIAQAVVLLGSATPAIETYYEALSGQHALLTMPQRVDGALLPQVSVVDMRQELAQGRRNVISLPLQELLQQTMDKGEQAIILLNRRGYSTFVICRECGYVMRCPHCTSSLVYHAKENRLCCHYCQKSEAVPDICPSCHSRYIRYFGTGTQRLEDELSKLFPEAHIARMDRDTTGSKQSYDRILNDFTAGKYNILLGTQMVAKGHDVKNVTAVGILSVDSVLNLPDFRAAERAFTLLTQAAGRAGRGKKQGKVVVQVYTPEHYAIQAGINHDYESFYKQEIIWRKELNYPPFSRLIKVTVQSANELTARHLAEDFAAQLRQKITYEETQIIGPFNAAIYKLNDVFRLYILLKTTELSEVRKSLMAIELFKRHEFSIDVDPLNVI